MQVHGNETVFLVTRKYLEKCKRNGWDTKCAFCMKEFEDGHVCHSKFNGVKYKKRHVSCAVTVGLVTVTDYEFAVLGHVDKNQLAPEVMARIKKPIAKPAR